VKRSAERPKAALEVGFSDIVRVAGTDLHPVRQSQAIARIRHFRDHLRGHRSELVLPAEFLNTVCRSSQWN